MAQKKKNHVANQDVDYHMELTTVQTRHGTAPSTLPLLASSADSRLLPTLYLERVIRISQLPQELPAVLIHDRVYDFTPNNAFFY